MKGRGRKPVPVVEGNTFGSKEDLCNMYDEKYTCRICFEENEDFSQLISPCLCKGTVTCPSLGVKWSYNFPVLPVI